MFEGQNHDINALGQPVGLPVANWTPPPLPTPGRLEGRTCCLERLEVAHAQDLHAANSLDVDGKNWTYLPYGPFATLMSYVEWVEQCRNHDDPLYFAIIDLETARPVGVASYLNINPGNATIEVGHINYSPLLQRTIQGTEAMYLMMKHAFELGYRRYEWKCNALNVASRQTAQRLGLSFEGIFRQARIVKGRNRDTAWYAAIDKDWPALSRAFTQWLSPSNFDGCGSQRIRLSDMTRQLLYRRG